MRKRMSRKNKALRLVVHNTGWLPLALGIPVRRWARKAAGMQHKVRP